MNDINVLDWNLAVIFERWPIQPVSLMLENDKYFTVAGRKTNLSDDNAKG